MLLAARSLSHLIEALPGVGAQLVLVEGLVRALCQQLIDIQYIDVAEQALLVSGATMCMRYWLCVCSMCDDNAIST